MAFLKTNVVLLEGHNAACVTVVKLARGGRAFVHGMERKQFASSWPVLFDSRNDRPSTRRIRATFFDFDHWLIAAFSEVM
jgi:hypothetical protein